MGADISPDVFALFWEREVEKQEAGSSGKVGFLSEMVQRWGHPHITEVTASGMDQPFSNLNKLRSIWRAVKTQVVETGGPKCRAICYRVFQGP